MTKTIHLILIIATCACLAGARPGAAGTGFTLRGVCFVDTDNSASFDPDEQGLDNATIAISRVVLGFFLNPVRSLRTDAAGAYECSDLSGGIYQIECLPPVDCPSLNRNPALLTLGPRHPERLLDFAFGPADAEALPVEVVLQADLENVPEGDAVVLSWTSANADTLSIDNGIGEVALAGARTIYPTGNITCTATATGPGGTARAAVSVTVLPKDGPTPAVPALSAAAGDGKVGLAWVNPADPLWQKTLIVRSTETYPATPAEGETIYEGTGTDWIDENRTPGVTCYYAAFSCTAGAGCDGHPARAAATPLDVSGADWNDWLTGPDPFADEVTEFEPAVLSGDPFGRESFPDVVLGPPCGKGALGGSVDVLSLGARVAGDNATGEACGGTITLKFTDNLIVNGPGPDFTVFENSFTIDPAYGRGMLIEPAVVSVSQDGRTFYRFPCDFVPLAIDDPEDIELWQHCADTAHYPNGFAGVHPVYANGLDPDPSDPEVSGGDNFDLDDLEGVALRWVRYVRIQATGDNCMTDADGDLIRHTPYTGACSGSFNSGFDLDAISAIHY